MTTPAEEKIPYRPILHADIGRMMAELMVVCANIQITGVLAMMDLMANRSVKESAGLHGQDVLLASLIIESLGQHQRCDASETSRVRTSLIKPAALRGGGLFWGGGLFLGGGQSRRLPGGSRGC